MSENLRKEMGNLINGFVNKQSFTSQDFDQLLSHLRSQIEQMENPYSDKIEYLIKYPEESDINRGRQEIAYEQCRQDILSKLQQGENEHLL